MTDWTLHMKIYYKANTTSEQCSRCNGSGIVGDHFKSIDGPENCPDCFGSGKIVTYPQTESPEIPEELVEKMRAAWKNYFDEKKQFTYPENGV